MYFHPRVCIMLKDIKHSYSCWLRGEAETRSPWSVKWKQTEEKTVNIND